MSDYTYTFPTPFKEAIRFEKPILRYKSKKSNKISKIYFKVFVKTCKHTFHLKKSITDFLILNDIF